MGGSKKKQLSDKLEKLLKLNNRENVKEFLRKQYHEYVHDKSIPPSNHELRKKRHADWESWTYMAEAKFEGEEPLFRINLDVGEPLKEPQKGYEKFTCLYKDKEGCEPALLDLYLGIDEGILSFHCLYFIFNFSIQNLISNVLINYFLLNEGKIV
jgi:hypothetical protein